MKTLLGLLVALSSTPVLANTIDQSMDMITAKVKECSVQMYSINAHGQKEYKHLKSNCAVVKVSKNETARIRVGGLTYTAEITETQYSDEDFYNVTIKEMQSGESKTLENVPAYGDVLLGVLGGDARGLPEQEI